MEKNRRVGVPGARKGGSVTVWGGCKCMCLGRLMCLKGDIALRMLRIGPVDVWDSISNVDNLRCTTDTECLSERAQVYHLLLLLLFFIITVVMVLLVFLALRHFILLGSLEIISIMK